MTKICSKCKEEKPLEAFDRNKNLKLGRDSSCKACRKAVKQASLDKLKTESPELWQERQRAYRERYRENHPERVKEQDRRHSLMYKFKMTVERYEEMLVAQGGVCAVCQDPPGDKRLAVDHDRSCCPGNVSCGECIRKLLCSKCNTALGLLNDSLEYIDRISNYVKEHR